jgi:hypothetical protein
LRSSAQSFFSASFSATQKDVYTVRIQGAINPPVAGFLGNVLRRPARPMPRPLWSFSIHRGGSIPPCGTS